MADIVRYACVSAMRLHKQFQRIGASARVFGLRGKQTLLDGYIVAAQADKHGSVTKVVDPPAVVAFPIVHVNTSGILDYVYAVTLQANRDALAPNSTGDLVPSSGANPRYAQPAGHKYVGFDTPMDRTPDLSGVSGKSHIGDKWTTAAFIAGYRHPTTYEYIANLNVNAVTWSSPLDRTDQPAEIEGVVCLSIPGEAIAALYPNWMLIDHVYASPVAEPAACVVERTVAGVKKASVYVHVLLAPYDNDGFRRAMLLLRVDIVPGRIQTITWSRLVPIDPIPSYATPSGLTYHTHDMRHVVAEHPEDDTVEAVCTYSFPGAGETDLGTRDVVLRVRADTGDNTHPISVDTTLGYRFRGIACSTKNALWGSNVPSTGPLRVDVDYSAPLLQVRDGVARTHALGAWYPVCVMRIDTGLPVVEPLTSVHRFVTDLSPGRVGMLVYPGHNYTLWSPVDIHLIELDEDTLEIISVRGVIGASVTPGVSGEYGRYISTVTPQVVDASGAVTTPAVLLCCIGNTTRLSTDGGYTWRTVATGVIGLPVYMGNRLHPVTLGETL